MYRCCCCINLRIGCIVIAILQIVGSLGIIGIPLYHSPPYDTCLIIDCLAGVTSGICLLIGGIKSNASAILVYLILAVINFIIRFVVWTLTIGLGAVFVIFYGSHKRPQIDGGHVLVVSIIGISITVTALSIYFWFCVCRFYQLTKYGKVTLCE